MKNSAPSKYTLGALAGLSLLGALAGCAATSSPESSSTNAAAGGATETYKDGTYTENGSYQSPGGTESITVALTLKANTVTAVTVTPHPADPNAAIYQKQFIDGIAAIVVGKDINTLQVSHVAGSSLTSGGFNAALTAIKADALG